LDADRVAAPLQIQRERRKIANISLVLRAGFSQVFGFSEVASSNLADKDLIEMGQMSQ